MSSREGARPLPALDARNRAFWTGGVDGRLHLQRCNTCERLIHPPTLLCPHDHSRDLSFVPVSGRGRVETWTRNDHSWFDGFPAPYVVAFVVPDEDDGVRLLTNLVDVDPDDLEVGAPVEVAFEHHAADGDDLYVPVFRPVDEARAHGGEGGGR